MATPTSSVHLMHSCHRMQESVTHSYIRGEFFLFDTVVYIRHHFTMKCFVRLNFSRQSSSEDGASTGDRSQQLLFLTSLFLCLWCLGGRVCHSFIPGMRNHNATHAVSTSGPVHGAVLLFKDPHGCLSHTLVLLLCFRTVQQEPTCLCCPGILWLLLMSSVRPVTPVTAE